MLRHMLQHHKFNIFTSNYFLELKDIKVAFGSSVLNKKYATIRLIYSCSFTSWVITFQAGWILLMCIPEWKKSAGARTRKWQVVDIPPLGQGVLLDDISCVNRHSVYHTPTIKEGLSLWDFSLCFFSGRRTPCKPLFCLFFHFRSMN